MSSPSESNQVVSPRQLKQFALPYHEKLQKVLAQRGIHRFYFHICGDQNLNLPYLAELASQWPHPAILSFGHEVDLTRAGELFPEDIIMGNVEPALFQTATPDEVYKVSTEALAKGTQVPGGFMLAPGCGMPVWASHDNVYAMTRAVQDWRN